MSKQYYTEASAASTKGKMRGKMRGKINAIDSGRTNGVRDSRMNESDIRFGYLTVYP